MLAALLTVLTVWTVWGPALDAAPPAIPAGGVTEDRMAGDLAAQLHGKWRLVSLHQAEGDLPVAPVLDFRDGVVAVFGGCNDFAVSPFFNPDGTLSLLVRPDPPLIQTCSPEASAVEKLLLQALAKARDVTFDGPDAIRVGAFGQEMFRAVRQP